MQRVRKFSDFRRMIADCRVHCLYLEPILSSLHHILKEYEAHPASCSTDTGIEWSDPENKLLCKVAFVSPHFLLRLWRDAGEQE